MSKAARIEKALLTVAWTAAICSALVFMVIKIRNWGPELDAPEQSDFAVYYDAAGVAARNSEMLYRVEEWTRVLERPVPSSMPFPYMPVIAVLLRPLGQLSFDTARRLWFWISAAQIVLALGLLARTVPAGATRRATILLAALHPSLLDTLHLGQINAPIALLTVASWLGLASRRRMVSFIAGMLLGAACAIKPVVAGLAIAALPRRNYAYLAGCLAGGLTMLGAGLLLMPIGVTRDYVSLLAGYSQRLTPPGIDDYLFWNQSVWAFWRKVFGDGHAGIRLLGGVTAACVLLVTLGRQWIRRGSRSAASDAASGMLAVLICEPVTWNHYMLAAAPLYAGAAGAVTGASRWMWRMLMPIGYTLTVLQRASVLLAPLLGVALSSSMTLFGLLAWWAATTFRTDSSSGTVQDSGE